MCVCCSFYEVEPTEAATNDTFEEEQYQEHTYEEPTESYQPMDFAAQEQPVETPVDFQAEVPAPVEIPAQIPVVEEDNELTYVVGRDTEEKILGTLTVGFLFIVQ